VAPEREDRENIASNHMAVVISMLRAVNLAGHHRIKMDALRELYTSLKLRHPETYVQSGNVIFETQERDLERQAKRIERAIEKEFGFHADVIVRTPAQMRDVVARNPFAKRRDIEPGKLIVTFLAGDPGEPAREAVRKVKIGPEELRIEGRELYVYFPDGMGRSKLPVAAISRMLKVPGTARNWNSVTKMLEMAEQRQVTND
jgi:uncharacterized protein (DUF1697 family)